MCALEFHKFTHSYIFAEPWLSNPLLETKFLLILL